MSAVLLIPTTPHVPMEKVATTLANTLSHINHKVGFFQPFAAKDGTNSSVIPAPISREKLVDMLVLDNLDDLMEEVYANYLQVKDELILVRGVGLTDSYSARVNIELAHALSAKVILVADNTDSNKQLNIAAKDFGGTKGRVIAGIVVNGDENSLKTVNTPFKVASLVIDDDPSNDGKAIDHAWLGDVFPKQGWSNHSPTAFRYDLVQKAAAAKKRIVLPEGDEPRTIEAAAICQRRGIAQCVLLGDPDKIRAVAKERGVTLPADIEIIEPASIADGYVAPMVERRKGKIDEAGAKKALEDTVFLGTMMLQMGDVDGLVSGAVHTTADTIRPAFQLIKTAPNYSLVSSVFFMLLPEQVVAYADCAVNPNPTAEQLAEIAIQTADSARAFGMTPRVAMISYSTGSSGAGPDVDRVVEATRLIKEKAPELLVDGPLQYDAATVPSVAKSKAPNSPVAGQANVFIFPDLTTGNTTYKAVQRSADVLSVGPMLQGLNKPVNDLSRGALVDDIVYTIALTAIQAAA